MERKAYVQAVAAALRWMAEWPNRTDDDPPGTAGTASPGEATDWMTRQARTTWAEVMERLRAMEAPMDLRSFHDRLLAAVDTEPGETRTAAHARPENAWLNVLMEFYTLCQQEGVEFPLPGTPAGWDEGGEEIAAWEAKLRQAMADRNHPDPDGAIALIKELRED